MGQGQPLLDRECEAGIGIAGSVGCWRRTKATNTEKPPRLQWPQRDHRGPQRGADGLLWLSVTWLCDHKVPRLSQTWVPQPLSPQLLHVEIQKFLGFLSVAGQLPCFRVEAKQTESRPGEACSAPGRGTWRGVRPEETALAVVAAVARSWVGMGTHSQGPPMW